MEHYLKSFDRIDVLVSQNDDMTFGAMEAMDEAGVTYGKDGQGAGDGPEREDQRGHRV